jgi:hypothetical protein
MRIVEAGVQGVRGRGLIVIGVAMALFVLGPLAQGAAGAPPLLSKAGVASVTDNSATLQATIDPKGTATEYRFEYGSEDCAASMCTLAGAGLIGAGSPQVVVKAPLAGLTPGTLYHFRIVAKHTGEPDVGSGDRIFATRAGIFSGLPDGRAYEQSSPRDKDGGDVLGDLPTVKASESGGGITFASTFGVPGGKGAQEFPTFLATRGPSSWSSEGLLPPFTVGNPPQVVGQRAQVIGWSPNFTEVFSKVTRLGDSREAALVVQSGHADPVTIAPYTAGDSTGAEYSYADQNQDGSVVIFESSSKLVPAALEDFPNVYAWNRDTGQLSLAGVYNDGNSPEKGTLAGPYLWVAGSSGRALSLGGSERGSYLRDERAVSLDGSVVFTEAGSGQLYRRINPTAEQSTTEINGKGEEECEDPAKACTVHISASHKTDGDGEGGTDAAGPQPAAFQAASDDGSEVFFTSHEKLTNDANTGPEQSPAQIELGTIGGAIEIPKLIAPQRAVGVAVDSAHVYWVDPARGTIGRADLSGGKKDDSFIVPGPTECEIEAEPGVFETITSESRPRFVAVNAEHVYWTNTGCLNGESEAIEGTGTIGRADIDGDKDSIESEFIKGASNPQGIAVNATHIYWANAGKLEGVRAIGWGTIEGEDIEQNLVNVSGNGTKPYGVALSQSHLYFSANEESNDNGYVRRAPLEGGEEVKSLFVGKEGIRGVAVDSGHVYWASQGEEAIGRATPELKEPADEFIELHGKPSGLAVDESHLYWSINGEAASNPGNDLYRYGPKEGQLEDLTPDSGGNGAEVQGVLGASADGEYVYFAANGVLDDAEEATPGNCKGPLGSASGKCNLYLWHEGSIGLVARLNVDGGTKTDARNWAATPREQFGTASYSPKTSFLSGDGRTLLFRSQEKLTPYDNEGVPEYYRFELGDSAGIRCATCNPTGEAAGPGPSLGKLIFPGLGPLASVSAVSARILSSSGDQAFFETSDALVPEDTNGQKDCPLSGTGVQNFPACNDVYEWEAADAGSCKEGSAAYSPISRGCIYLISTGKSEFPSFLADASADGKDVFFFSRQQLVGQDKDELQDVYDARVGGGFASQNPSPAILCESAEACRVPTQAPPVESGPATPNFFGPNGLKPKKQKAKGKSKKGKAKKKGKRKGKGRRQGR